MINLKSNFTLGVKWALEEEVRVKVEEEEEPTHIPTGEILIDSFCTKQQFAIKFYL